VTCTDCGAELIVPSDSIAGEIIRCPDCGLDYVLIENETGLLTLKELIIEGEDWGE